VYEKGSKEPKTTDLKSDIRTRENPFATPVGRPSQQTAAMTIRDFNGVVTMSATDYARQEGQKYAQWAATLVRETIEDMSAVLGVLREAIPFTEAQKMRPIMESYAAATSEMRRALGLVEDVSAAGPRTLVQIQCVGDVTVQSRTDEAAPSVDLPDFE
jgi:hypothetical protein